MQLPLKFFGKASSSSGIQTPWQIECSNNKAICSVPVEFSGPGNGFSPEDFFLQSIINCFTGTFKVFAEHSKIKFNELNVEGILTVDKNNNNQIVMKHILLKIYAKGVEQEERFKNLAEKVMKSGYILNSVKTELEYEVSFSTL